MNAVFVWSCATAMGPPISAQSVTPAMPEAVHSKGYADMDHCQPVRPENAPHNKEPRTVSFAFLVGEDGQLRQSKITKSSGFRKLDRAALVAFQRCTFHPQLTQGRPEMSWVMLSYQWEAAVQN